MPRGSPPGLLEDPGLVISIFRSSLTILATSKNVYSHRAVVVGSLHGEPWARGSKSPTW